MNVKTNKKGFTLVELIVVIAIIGILAAVLIPTIGGYVKRAQVSADEQEVNAILDVYNNHQMELELGQTTLTFDLYYEQVTGKTLIESNVSFYMSTGQGKYTLVWPVDKAPFKPEAEFMIYDGHYATLIRLSDQDILQSGADSAARKSWINNGGQ